MKHTKRSAMALLLTAVLLLGGCVARESTSTLGDGTSTSSDFSDAGIASSSNDSPKSTNISENSSSSEDPESAPLIVPTEFTEDDRELQKILKELWPAALNIELMFNGNYNRGNDYVFIISGDKVYYDLIPENTKTSDGMLTIPQTYEEMQELLLKYHTKDTAEKYMRDVNKASMTENPDGTYNVTLDTDNKGAMFIEIGGRMYCKDSIIAGGFLIDYDTAKMIEKTDDLIHFSCICYRGELDYKNEDGLAWNEDGFLKYERGGWKLHYNSLTRFEMD